MVLPGVGHGEFNAISVRSPGDAWAVGYRGSGYGDSTWSGSGLIEHWNGSRWSVVPSPVFSGSLNDVVAISPTDAWAVGGMGLNQNPGVIEHWDGRHWVRSKNVRDSGLNGVTGLSSRDVWAVGNNFILRWNGSRWSRRYSLGVLDDVIAISRRDVWAVGEGPNSGLFATHWDGRRWRDFPGPNVADQESSLSSVTAISTTNLWAVGEAQDGYATRRPVVYRWNGTTWKTTVPADTDGGLSAIAARSATDIWTVGWDNPMLGGLGPLISHWKGKSWRVEELPLDIHLLDIVVGKKAHLWAVGSRGNPTAQGPEGNPTDQYGSFQTPIPRPAIERYGC
jgi:hypothetical protein